MKKVFKERMGGHESLNYPVPVKAAVFDNDNTLYAEPPDAKDKHQMAAIQAVYALLQELSDEDIEELIKESREKYGGSLEIFIQEYCLRHEEIRERHYDALVEITALDSEFFKPNVALPEALQALKDCGVERYIATHGNRIWTLYSLALMDLSSYFDEKNMVFKDDGCEGKNVSSQMYERVLDLAGVSRDVELTWRGAGYAMVEDTVENLENAKKTGMMTILIDREGDMQEGGKPWYVDKIVPDETAAVQVILQHNARFAQENRLFWAYDPPETA